MASSVKFKTVRNNFPKMEQCIKAIGGKKVTAGAIGENAWLAGIHEYGCRIKVTDKMRVWLHAHGLHLKEETKEIIIPERSFLRGGFDEHHKNIVNNAEALLPAVIDGVMPCETFLNSIGSLFASKIKEYARELNQPPNHPFTTAEKGEVSNPLVNTGNMIGSINYRVE